VKLDQLLPTKQMTETAKQTPAYKTILASIGEVGVIEPLAVHPQGGGKYLLLDGHFRMEALKDLGIDEAFCLVSTDDEGYTYNRQRIHVAPIQANRMVLKAIDDGVPEDRIAKTLNLSLATIRENRSMLRGICPEALELLKDKHVAMQTFREFKRVKAMRQIEMAELMTASATYATAYAKALVAMTPRDQLVEVHRPAKEGAAKPRDLARIEHETRSLEKDFLLAEDAYGRTVLELTLARGYLKKLLDNGRVVRYLAQKHPTCSPSFSESLRRLLWRIETPRIYESRGGLRADSRLGAFALAPVRQDALDQRRRQTPYSRCGLGRCYWMVLADPLGLTAWRGWRPTPNHVARAVQRLVAWGPANHSVQPEYRRCSRPTWAPSCYPGSGCFRRTRAPSRQTA
jgi:ParB-like chromosome segregation protein Spo0J